MALFFHGPLPEERHVLTADKSEGLPRRRPDTLPQRENFVEPATGTLVCRDVLAVACPGDDAVLGIHEVVVHPTFLRRRHAVQDGPFQGHVRQVEVVHDGDRRP